jgi:antirestriction protein ArdC|tara:strand:+ start:69 stop:929 length:861 start_codon:yes stop_codon:yes gene_type:complete
VETVDRKQTVYDIVTAKICDELEKGTVPWQRPWVGGGQMPANLITKRPYSGINPLLLSLSGYASPFWLTYKQAAAAGGQVRKGEKSTLVVFYAKLESKTRTKKDEAPETFSILRYYNLFNIGQCDNLDALVPVLAENDTPPIEAAESIVAGYSDKPTIDGNAGAAWYSPNLDLLGMPARETFTSADGYYSTLFHECIHSTGHVSRLDRKGVGTKAVGYGSATYSKEELIAELGAAFLCAEAGIENTIEQSAAYCASWLQALRGDSKLIVSAASGAGRAARYITGKA